MKSSIFKRTRLALAFSFVLVCAGTSFATNGDLGGVDCDGSDAAPYQISDAGDLRAFAKKVNGGENVFAFAILTKDICLNACGKGESVYNADGSLNGTDFTSWIPIGMGNYVYRGTFDGKGHTISGLYVNDDSMRNVGLFGKIGVNAIIRNVGVVDSYFKGDGNVGGIVGNAGDGLVSGSYNAGSVNGNAEVGGIVGYANGGLVSGCYNAGSVNGNEDVGGIVGIVYGGLISDSYNAGSVNGNEDVGGIVGYSAEENRIVESFNSGNVNGTGRVGGIVGSIEADGSVSDSYNSGNVNGTGRVGGIVGSIEADGSVSDSYNSGTVSGTEEVGGIVGCNLGLVSDSYNSRTVSGYGYVGGVVGSNNNIVSNCYNSGTVSGDSESYDVGGVVGINLEGGAVSNSYNKGSVGGRSFVGGGVGSNYGLVSGCYNTGLVNAYFLAGGGVAGNNLGLVSDSYNSGTVSGNGSVGGVVGISNGIIRNSYDAGTIKFDENVFSSMGGVVAENGGSVINCFYVGTMSGGGNGDVGCVAAINNGSVINSYCSGSISEETGKRYYGGVVGFNKEGGTVINSYFNEGGVCDSCDSDVGTGKSSKDFADGSVARLLHDWCEKDGENCKEGGLNGAVWGQNLRTEKSQPDFSGVIGFKYGSVAFFGLDNGVADSAYVDAVSSLSVNFPDSIVVKGPITFKRSFSDNGFSTIMLPFKPNFVFDADTIENVHFYEFSKYDAKEVSVLEVGQKALEANTPYLISAAGASEIVFKKGGTFDTQNGGVYDKETNIYKKSSADGWTVYGTYDYKIWEKDDEGLGKIYGFAGADGNDSAIVGQFCMVDFGAYIYPMRAYLEYNVPATVRSASNPAHAVSSVMASLPKTIDVVVVEKDAKTGEQTTKLIGSFDSRTGEFKTSDRHFDLNGRNVGKKPAAKGSYYSKKKAVAK